MKSTPRGGEMSYIPELAICIRNREGRVVEMTEACRRICGRRPGVTCRGGCVLHHRPSKDSDESTVLLVGRRIGRGLVDLLIRKTGKIIVTFLFPRTQDSSERTPPADVMEEFTNAEKRVAALAGAGLSNLQIAERLKVSRATVRTHLNRIYQKWPDGRQSLATRR